MSALRATFVSSTFSGLRNARSTSMARSNRVVSVIDLLPLDIFSKPDLRNMKQVPLDSALEAGHPSPRTADIAAGSCSVNVPAHCRARSDDGIVVAFPRGWGTSECRHATRMKRAAALDASAEVAYAEGGMMARRTLTNRVETLENAVEGLREERTDAASVDPRTGMLEEQFAQFRGDVRTEFSAIHEKFGKVHEEFGKVHRRVWKGARRVREGPRGNSAGR